MIIIGANFYSESPLSTIFSLASPHSPEYASVQAGQGEAIEEGRGEGQVGPVLQVSTQIEEGRGEGQVGPVLQVSTQKT